MYSDLLDVLGSQAAPRSSRASEPPKHVALSFKAGSCEMTLKENGSYLITPDTRRGLVQLVWSRNELKWEWGDRPPSSRSGSSSSSTSEPWDSFVITGGESWQRVSTSKGSEDPTERVYVLSSAPNADSLLPPYRMYWMQDETEETDDLVSKINQYLTTPADAAPSSEGPDGVGSGNGASSGDQADALSNILQNLGNMQSSSAAGGNTDGSSSTPIPSATTAGAATGTLTLADLQGAMAGLQTDAAQQRGATAVPLSDVVSSQAVTELMADEAARARLLEFLPESQRSEEFLEENLRSPQVQATLRSLSHALLPDDTGSMEGYHSVIANFQLSPADGEAALRTGNPIQAFLDCIAKSVEADKEAGGNAEKEESKEESKEEENADEEKMEE